MGAARGAEIAHEAVRAAVCSQGEGGRVDAGKSQKRYATRARQTSAGCAETERAFGGEG